MVLVTHPIGTVILGADNKTVYLISFGSKKGFATPEEYNSHGYTFGELVKASSADLILPDGGVAPFADGTLVLDTTDGKTVYIIDNGRKRGFTTAEVFNKLGYKFSQAVKGNLSKYPTDNPIGSYELPHPAGALVTIGNTIYYISATGKIPIPNMNVFNSWKWSLSKVVAGNTSDSILTTLGMIGYREGTLVKDTNGAIYIKSGGKLRPFSSMQAFNNLGYKTSNIKNMATGEINSYSIGETIF
jgi:hypothetical protein